MSRDWHQCNANSPSEAVFACSTEEVAAANARAIDDSRCPLETGLSRSPGHCFVDYRGYSTTEKRLLRAILLAKAIARKEIDSVDIRMPVEELSDEDLDALIQAIEKWSEINGREPSMNSDHVVEKRYAEVMKQAQITQDGSL